MPEPLSAIAFAPPLPSDRETLLKVLGSAKCFRARIAGVTLNFTGDQLPVGLSGKRAIVLVTPDKRRVSRILVAGLSDADAAQRWRLLKMKNSPTGFHRWN